MPTHRSFDQHLAGLRDATQQLARHATAAGLDVAIPTCPDWTVRRMIGHQGYIHRWARAAFTGDDVPEAATEKAGRSSSDPVAWLRDGAIALVQTLVAAPEDAEAITFLHDAPAPRLFWARRQCHETTIHAVDALAATLGRAPMPDETGIDPDLALDGVDELVLGFVPRSRSTLRSPEPLTLAIVPTDADHSWSVRVTPDAPPVSTRHEGHQGPVDGDLVATADALTLYLALWHRTPLDAAIWPLWHGTAVL